MHRGASFFCFYSFNLNAALRLNLFPIAHSSLPIAHCSLLIVPRPLYINNEGTLLRTLIIIVLILNVFLYCFVQFWINRCKVLNAIFSHFLSKFILIICINGVIA